MTPDHHVAATDHAPARRRRPARAKSLGAPALLAAAALVGVLLTACGSDETPADGERAEAGGGRLIVYSGRSEELVKPLFEKFTEETGIQLDVRYGDSADLALAIDQEGDRGRADVFFSQSPGAIAYLAAKNRLSRIDDSTLELVGSEDRSEDGTWVGVSGRARVLVYNTDQVTESDLPASVFDLTDPSYAGKVAVAPTNGSFIDFVSGLREMVGDERAEEWLAGMAANRSPNYANNNAILEAVARGEVPMGLANHYYLVRAKEEEPGLAAANHFFPDGDPGSMLLVAAAGITATSTRTEEAQRLVAFLLSEEAQTYFAEETFEYPLARGVAPAGSLPPLEDLPLSRLDLDRLGDQLSSTLDMIRASGIQQ